MWMRLMALAAILISSTAHASADRDDDNDQTTIRASDIPPDAPSFTAYPAKPFTGSNAKLKITRDPVVHLYKTRLREWSKTKANFAGHYILATWGCGTDCVQIMIIDTKSGRVYHPKGIASNVSLNVHDELLVSGKNFPGDGSVHFQPDSELLVLIGAPEEDMTRRGISYFVWHNNSLRMIRHIPKPGY